MKLQIKNIGERPLERLGFVFEPQTVQEVDVYSIDDYMILISPVNFEVEIIEKDEQIPTEVIDNLFGQKEKRARRKKATKPESIENGVD